jgi:putative two-component system response regulator
MIALSVGIAYLVSKYVAFGLTRLENEKNQVTGELKNVIFSSMTEMIEERDETTRDHIERTTLYLKVLIDGMKEFNIYADELSQYDEALLLQSCRLHDLGKVSIRDVILLKPDKFTDDEYELIKAHTTLGEQVIDRIKSSAVDSTFLDYAKVFAATHHEKWDGNGYPKGLTGRDIPLLGRMMAIVDVYDALVSPRQYKKAYSASEAAQIIKDGRGTHFDPLLADLFADICDRFEGISKAFLESGVEVV